MKARYPLFLIIVAGLFFYAGYTVGLKKAPFVSNTSAHTETEVDKAKEVTSVVTEKPSAQPEPAPLDPETKAMITAHEHSLRAAKKQITFTDTQDRELVAEVIEATPQSIKVRRISDGAEVNIPINMLCAADQAFVSYLAKQTPPATTLSMEDKIWDELFK